MDHSKAEQGSIHDFTKKKAYLCCVCNMYVQLKLCIPVGQLYKYRYEGWDANSEVTIIKYGRVGEWMVRSTGEQQPSLNRYK